MPLSDPLAAATGFGFAADFTAFIFVVIWGEGGFAAAFGDVWLAAAARGASAAGMLRGLSLTARDAGLTAAGALAAIFDTPDAAGAGLPAGIALAGDALPADIVLPGAALGAGFFGAASGALARTAALAAGFTGAAACFGDCLAVADLLSADFCGLPTGLPPRFGTADFAEAASLLGALTGALEAGAAFAFPASLALLKPATDFGVAFGTGFCAARAGGLAALGPGFRVATAGARNFDVADLDAVALPAGLVVDAVFLTALCLSLLVTFAISFTPL